jgi:hypothetical protein
MTHIQTKKNQLAQYDIVGMFAENLVEVGYVLRVFEISGFS